MHGACRSQANQDAEPNMTRHTNGMTRRTAITATGGLLAAGIGIGSVAASGDDPNDGDDQDVLVTTRVLLDAIYDWRDDEIDTERLLIGIRAWRNEWTIPDLMERWRDGEIPTDAMLYYLRLGR